jgi:serine/threonine protein kinase
VALVLRMLLGIVTIKLDISSRNEEYEMSIRNEHVEVYEYGLNRFIDEAKALATFNRNPGIVAVYDYFLLNNTAYMAMQYLDGKTWLDLLQERKKMSVNEAMAILLPVLDTLRAVHEVGMLHRDISPDNIVILQNRQVKLIDFGAARYAMKQKQQPFSIVFKQGYTPEEQYRGQGKIGPWTDLYALAATFYRAITGRVPVDAMNRLENDTLLPPSKLGVAIGKNMESALMRCLAVRGENRFQSVHEWKEAMLIHDEEEINSNAVDIKQLPTWGWLIIALTVIIFFKMFF